MFLKSFALAAAVTCTLPAFGASITLADSTFNNADWTAVAIGTNPLTTASFTQIAGGNPGPSRQTTFTFGPASAGQSGGVVTGNIGTLLTYDPSVQGAIDSLEFSFDLINLGTVNFNATVTGRYLPAFRQGGHVYYLVTTSAAAQATTWTNFTRTGLSSTEWVSLTIAGNPDLSASGTLIEFGYLFFYSGTCPTTATAGCSAGTTRSGLDNYSVRINIAEPEPPTGEIPEPSTYALVGGGLALATLFKRRK